MGCTITNDKNRNKLRYMSKQLVSQTKTQNKKHKQCEFYWILSEANGTDIQANRTPKMMNTQLTCWNFRR